MAAALTVSLMGTAAEADAAKKIKLSKKSITVTKGKSKKVTQTSHIKKLPLCPKNQEKTDIYFVC